MSPASAELMFSSWVMVVPRVLGPSVISTVLSILSSRVFMLHQLEHKQTMDIYIIQSF